MNFMRKWMITIILLVAVLLLAGCSQSDELQISKNAPAAFASVKTLDIDFSPKYTRCGDDFILIRFPEFDYSNDLEKEYAREKEISWIFMNSDLELGETVSCRIPVPGIVITGRCVEDSEMVFIIHNKYKDSKAYTILTYSLDGELLSDVAVESDPEMKNDEHVSVQAILDNKDVLLGGYDYLRKYDQNGKLLGKTSMPGKYAYVHYLSVAAPDTAVISGQRDGYSYLSMLDIDQLSFEKKNMFTNMVEVVPAAKRDGYDFCGKIPDGIIGIHFSDNSATMLLDYEASGIVPGTVNGFCWIDDDNILIEEQDVPRSYDVRTGVVSLYTRMDPEDIVEKKNISLGGIYVTDDIRQKVGEFNKKSEEYKISIKDYTEIYGDEAENQFRLDLLVDEIPDIIMLKGLSDPDNYIKKGVFTDLYPLMDTAGISKDDFLPNVLEAGSVDGKLYTFGPKFSINGVGIVREEILEGKEGLSVFDIAELEKKYNCEGGGIQNGAREVILSDALDYTVDDYIDFQSGECRFETDGFKKLLEWSGKYGTLEEVSRERNDSGKKNPGFTNHEVLYSNVVIRNFVDFSRNNYRDFEKKGVLTGFPGVNGSGECEINPVYSLCISENCEDKESAFAFIEMFMEDGYQFDLEDPYSGGYFPAKKNAYEQMAKDAATKKDSVMNLNGEKVEIPPMTDEEISMVRSFVENSNRIKNSDPKIVLLVLEEAEMYYQGQRSLDDTAAMIQNRVGTYVQERQ